MASTHVQPRSSSPSGSRHVLQSFNGLKYTDKNVIELSSDEEERPLASQSKTNQNPKDSTSSSRHISRPERSKDSRNSMPSTCSASSLSIRSSATLLTRDELMHRSQSANRQTRSPQHKNSSASSQLASQFTIQQTQESDSFTQKKSTQILPGSQLVRAICQPLIKPSLSKDVNSSHHSRGALLKDQECAWSTKGSLFASIAEQMGITEKRKPPEHDDLEDDSILESTISLNQSERLMKRRKVYDDLQNKNQASPQAANVSGATCEQIQSNPTSLAFHPATSLMTPSNPSRVGLMPLKGARPRVVHLDKSSCPVHGIDPLVPLPSIKPKSRAQSPDWTETPCHLRPLQGQERPGEFSDELQKTWILQNKPDLSSPLGHLIFTEEINTNQMWENPEIPRIDVIVPQEIKDTRNVPDKDNISPEVDSDHKSDAIPIIQLDDALAPPLEFVYTDRLVYRTHERPLPPNWHCNCHGDCRNNPKCECRAFQSEMIRKISSAMNMEDIHEDVKNFEGFAYSSTRRPLHSHSKKNDTDDPEARAIREIFTLGQLPVFECNSLCGCGPDCINRTVGRGRREKLSIEKTLMRGWGVFADHPISIGRLVTHYSGEIITDPMSSDRGKRKYDRIGRTYVFDLDPWWIDKVYTQKTYAQEGIMLINENIKSVQGPSNTSEAGLLSNTSQELTAKKDAATKATQIVTKDQVPEDSEVEGVYSVDAFLYGNISRFINHSCNANTAVVPVYIDDGDPTRPIFAMFANKMIKTGKEITTSYSDPHAVSEDQGATKTGNHGSNGRYMACKCGAHNCKGIMFA
ncbi:hypothetical protein O181_008910 [Austropuccinia psidii MF-1]|uniref:SET domain-containing protein n=1 Tax=Austropuccinia psidii MF-1 TaxID=1389203 RepID=A0A9Q3GJC6_9BASI|nr:hypothetical protein [Austropuccinia psidii MF-1]